MTPKSTTEEHTLNKSIIIESTENLLESEKSEEKVAYTKESRNENSIISTNDFDEGYTTGDMTPNSTMAEDEEHTLDKSITLESAEKISENEKSEEKESDDKESQNETSIPTNDSDAEMVFPKQRIGCEFCEKTFPNNLALKKHINSSHQANKSSECPLCQKVFYDHNTLLQHVSTDHEKNQPFECRICTLPFTNEDSLNKHIQNYHPINVF